MTDSKPDLISRLKRKLRQNRLLSLLVGCPYPARRWNRCVKRLLQQLPRDAKILDLGAGRHRRARNVINLDIEPTPEIDLIGDGHFLPFKENTFDAVISEAVLEHVRSPNRVVQEIYRVLKPGGYVCVAVPFLQGYHASPQDYQRWTVSGIVELCAAFSEIESGACAGPTASLHWIFREYVGLLFSFGSLLLAKAISLLVGWLTFPLLILDVPLSLHKDADVLASAVYYFGKKP
ncbi:MAG: class I SAM-dependent methyltransferase [Candidatus Poribacteria bacterium]|nr:class I SAM-dependent methyltransferase [Candidatus Poribacteria bacterium]